MVIDKLNDDVREAVANNLKFNLDNNQQFIEYSLWLEKATPWEIMDRYLTWNGIIGFTTDIMEALENINRSKAPVV